MALIDQIEMLGASVDGGLIDRDDAAELLAELSDGGLTKRGALRALAEHRDRRRQGDQMLADVVVALDAVQSAATPEEFLAAHDAMLAEAARQRPALRERNRQRILDNLRRDLLGDED